MGGGTRTLPHPPPIGRFAPSPEMIVVIGVHELGGVFDTIYHKFA